MKYKPVTSMILSCVALAAVAKDDIRLYNIVPYSPGCEASVAADILRTHRETGLETFLYSVSLDPRGRPASANVARACESFRKIKAGLTDEVKFGFLLQSIMGHWLRADREIEPWQRSVGPTGQETRFCVLDGRYRDYIRDTAAALAKEKPCFILADDDIKAFAYGKVECFCPLHAAEFNRRTGRNLTPEQFRAAVRDAKPDDEVARTFNALRGEIVLTTARLIREGIDSVDPSIPAGGCMSGAETAEMLPRIRALAGPKHPTLMRFASGDYCEMGRVGIASVALRTQTYSQFYGDAVAVKLDESDTFPHTLYSRGERSFHSKLALAFFLGLDGAKLWFVGMKKGTERVPAAYDRALAKNMPLYRALHAAMRGSQPVGVRLPTFRPQGVHPLYPHKFDFCGGTEWLTSCLVVYGIPWTTDFSRAPGGVVLLEGSNTVNRLTDGELDTLFAGRVFADGGAVRALAARGRTGDLGCAPAPGDPIYNTEVIREGGVRPPLLREPKLTPLKTLSPEARVFSELRYGIGGASDADTTLAAVGSCLYANPRGGSVFSAAFAVPNQGGFSDQNLRRKEWMVRALRAIDPDFPLVSANDEPNMTLARRAADGSLVVYTINLGYDDIPALRYDTPKAVSVERMGADGKWTAVPTARTGRVTEAKSPIACFECAVLRLK